MSVFMSADHTGADFREIEVWDLCEKSVKKIQIRFFKSDNKYGTLHEELNMFCCCRRHKIAIKAFLTAICTVTM